MHRPFVLVLAGLALLTALLLGLWAGQDAPAPHVVVARARTDQDGLAALRAPAGAFHLRVTGLAHVAAVQPVAVAGADVDVALAVQRAAVVRGRLTPADAVRRLRALSRAGDQPVAVLAVPAEGAPRPPAVVDEDGAFVLGGLDAETYTLSLRYWLRTGEVRADTVELEAASVTLAAGEQRELELDIAALLPGRVRGRILAGGAPLADVHCFLRRNGPGPFLNLRVATDRDGRFEGLVPAGDYGFAMTYPAQPGPGWLNIVLPETWRLAPGAEHQLALDVPLRRARLLVVRGDAPVEGARVRVVREGYFLPGGLTSDAQGRVEVYPAPLDAFELEVTVGDEKERLGPFDLPPGATEGDVRVQLPG